MKERERERFGRKKYIYILRIEITDHVIQQKLHEHPNTAIQANSLDKKSNKMRVIKAKASLIYINKNHEYYKKRREGKRGGERGREEERSRRERKIKSYITDDMRGLENKREPVTAQYFCYNINQYLQHNTIVCHTSL